MNTFWCAEEFVFFFPDVAPASERKTLLVKYSFRKLISTASLYLEECWNFKWTGKTAVRIYYCKQKKGKILLRETDNKRAVSFSSELIQFIVNRSTDEVFVIAYFILFILSLFFLLMGVTCKAWRGSQQIDNSVLNFDLYSHINWCKLLKKFRGEL